MLYLALTLAAGVLAWIVLSAFSSPRLLSQSGNTLNAHLSIDNARLQSAGFPLRYIPRIQQIAGVENANWYATTGYGCDNATHKHLIVVGWGGEGMQFFRAMGAGETDIEAWQNTENGVLVASGAASRCGLNPPGVMVSPYVNGHEMPLQVIAILPEINGRFDEFIYAHYDYINRFQKKNYQNIVRSVNVKVSDPAMLDKVGMAIEREFESSDPPLQTEVRAETSILGRFGQVQGLLLLITGAMTLCVFLVFCAVLIHLTGQRRASMAVLQTLGFTGRTQFLALLLEITGIISLGAMLGIAAGYAVLTLLAPWTTTTLGGSFLQPVDGTVLVLIPAGLLLLVITLTWPAMQIAKLKPIDYLRL